MCRCHRVLLGCLVLILAGACMAPFIAPGAGGAALVARRRSERHPVTPEPDATASPVVHFAATLPVLPLVDPLEIEPELTALAPLPTATVSETQAPALTLTATVISMQTPLPTFTVTNTQAPALTPTPSTVPPLPDPAGPTPDGTGRSIKVPILMYHYISQAPANADRYRKDLSLSPDRFESHLAYLRDAGYHTISLDDLLYAVDQGRPLPEKPIVLTFDDGYVDNYTNAFPLLRKYGMTGHFFLITDPIDQGNPQYLSWSQVEEMAAAGQYFGSHTRTHPDLRNKSTDYLVWQVLGSTEALQKHLGYRPHWAAYPSGRYDERVIAIFRSANYWGCLATEAGADHGQDEAFHLTRLRISGKYTVENLKAVLRAYQ